MNNCIVCLFLLFISVNHGFCNEVVVENNNFKLTFDASSGMFLSMYDIENDYEYLEQYPLSDMPWEIKFQNEKLSLNEIIKNKQFEFKYTKIDQNNLEFSWYDFDGFENLKVTIWIRIDSNKPLSYWNISLEGLETNRVDHVVFPKITRIKKFHNEYAVIPDWMGSLISEPRQSLLESKSKQMEWSYPGPLSSQVIGVYGAKGQGFYGACNDNKAYVKNFSLSIDNQSLLIFQIKNFPSLDIDTASYSPKYEAIIGTFYGDWFDVAEEYKSWALKQEWVENSRFKNKQIPEWLENTALWIWNRGHSKNVISPAIELKELLGLPVNIHWHWWHNCSYDDNFPEYFPPREGKKSFIKAIQKARKYGVNAHIYMNMIQWGNSSTKWNSGEIKPYLVKDIEGNERSHVYNIFSGNALVNMCIGTEFWKDYYSQLCTKAVNEYFTSGVYMDQTCLNVMCYDKNHGHGIGGGNYWVENSAKLIKKNRSFNFGNIEPIFTGEGSGENWLPHLDAFLTLQASRERYSGVNNVETIPFFQAVYHPYSITFGSYSSLVTPPYDELWPEKFAPDNTEELLDEKFNDQFYMEQARSFVWGMQPTIANYHSFIYEQRKDEIDFLLDIARLRYQNLKYLLYGEFLKSPEDLLEVPEKEIDISKLSIYAGRKGESVTSFVKKVPLIYSGTWRSEDNNIGIALANIGDQVMPINFSINTENYNLPPKGKVRIITNMGNEIQDTFTNGKVEIKVRLKPKNIGFIEIIGKEDE